jgi:hypothetical protein
MKPSAFSASASTFLNSSHKKLSLLSPFATSARPKFNSPASCRGSPHAPTLGSPARPGSPPSIPLPHSRSLLGVTRTRVPYIASTTPVHRNPVMPPLLSTLFSLKTQRSNQPYSVFRSDQNNLSQIRSKPRRSPKMAIIRFGCAAPKRAAPKTLFDDQLPGDYFKT